MKYKVFPLILMVLVIGCHRKSVDYGGKANEHMHQTPTDELIQHFESSERNEYQKPDLVLDYLDDIKEKKIMDLGAGSGYFTFRFAAAGAKVIAADVDDDFQKSIRDRINRDGLSQLKIELRKLPYDSPELQTEEVDMVFLANTYHHLEDRVKYLRKIKKGLVPDGELIIIDFYKKEMSIGPPPDHKISKEKVLNELKEAGFTVVELNTELLEYQYIIKAKP